MTNLTEVIIFIGRQFTTFDQRYCQLMERHAIRCINVEIRFATGSPTSMSFKQRRADLRVATITEYSITFLVPCE
uniref:Uncharacterized protein LOC107476452 isoform X2 n=1 Tax=Rhizophora mucronata TaxID=61149 RepID=A0A2P2KUZ0_RHIMU